MERWLWIMLLVGTVISVPVAAQDTNAFTPVHRGALCLLDINGDERDDLLIGGMNPKPAGNRAHILIEAHLNQGNGQYLKQWDTPFKPLFGGTLTAVDLNNDGLKDLVQTGFSSESKSVTAVYFNYGQGEWMPAAQTFIGMHNTAVVCEDLNEDGLVDILIMGSHQDEFATLLYLNEGENCFRLHLNHPFLPLTDGQLFVNDLNGDGHLDVFQSGWSHKGEPVAQLFFGQGDLQWEEDRQLVVRPTYRGGGALIHSPEGDQLMLYGYNDDWRNTGRTYFFDRKANTFLSFNSPIIDQSRFGSMAQFDLDGDGREDVLQTGQLDNGTFLTTLFMNKGLGKFERSPDTLFAGIISGPILCMDFNEDQLPDLVYSGFDGNEFVFYVCTNLGNGQFSNWCTGNGA